VEREEELSIICIKVEVVVEGKGRDRSTERGSVQDEEYRGKNRALGNTARGSMKGREVVTLNTTGAR